MRPLGLLAAGLWLTFGTLPAQGAPAPDVRIGLSPDVRIGLYRYAPPAWLSVSAPSAWSLGAAGPRTRVKAGVQVLVRAEGHHVVALVGGRAIARGAVLRLRGPAPWTLTPARQGPRRFSGDLALRAERGTLIPVLSQPRADYVLSCVGDEMPPDWPAAALEAQAIASRTYALASVGRHAQEGFDFCDLTHCQRYRGLAGADARVAAAVARSGDRRLTWRGRPAETPWHAACGGWRAPNQVVFGGAARPYLQGGLDGPPKGKPWCEAAKVGAWRFEVAPDRLARACRAAGLLGGHEPLGGLSVQDRTAGGYATSVRLEGEFPRRLSGYALWMALGPHFGWGDLKSPAFRITRDHEGYRFDGHGLGHGVGMCQWGARGQALAGRSAAEILTAYYPGTRLQ
jgi:stage II sporulation protein D